MFESFGFGGLQFTDWVGGPNNPKVLGACGLGKSVPIGAHELICLKRRGTIVCRRCWIDDRETRAVRRRWSFIEQVEITTVGTLNVEAKLVTGFEDYISNRQERLLIRLVVAHLLHGQEI